MRRARSWADLATEVGCRVDELPAALDRLRPTPTEARRRYAVDRYFGKAATLTAIAQELGVSRERVRALLRGAMRELRAEFAGMARYSVRLRNVLASLGLSEDPLAAAPTLDCDTFLRTKNAGIVSLAELHRHLREANLSLRCGCPQSKCAVAKDRLRQDG